MTKHELDAKLNAAVEHTAPDNVIEVLSRCMPRQDNTIVMPKRRPRLLSALVAACLLVALLGGGFAWQRANAVATTVSLDVNPGIQLAVNRKEKVLSCKPLNEDAAQALDGMELKGVQLDVAVNAIVGALVRSGYLDDISSAILISVEDKDTARAERLERELTTTVNQALEAAAGTAAVLSQTVEQTADRQKLAETYQISLGKAALVEQVRAVNGALEPAGLAQLSVEELEDLLKTGAPGMPVGKVQALAAAQTQAGALPENAGAVWDVDPELDEQPACYEIELKTAFGKFEYRIDAYTGEVLSGPANVQVAGMESAYIGEAAAKAGALAHAGVTEGQTKYCNVWLEYDDGCPEHYKVEFEADSMEYQYEIGLLDGAVLECEREVHGESHHEDHHGGEHHGSAQSAAADIGAAAAKAAALQHAQVTEAQTSKMKVEADYEDGRLEYEVEFKVGSVEYEYRIDGASGAILEFERNP